MMLFIAFPPQTFNPKKIYLEYSAALPLDLSPEAVENEARKENHTPFVLSLKVATSLPASSYRQSLFLPRREEKQRER
jgi:hypothetical protein